MKWSHGDDHKSQTAVGLCFGVFVKTSPCLWLTVKSREACAEGFPGNPPVLTASKKRTNTDKRTIILRFDRIVIKMWCEISR